MCTNRKHRYRLARMRRQTAAPKHAKYGKICRGSRRTLVWTDGRVKLHAVAAVDVLLALLIPPGYAEGNHALRLHQASLKAFQSSSQHAVNKPAEGWAWHSSAKQAVQRQ